VRALTPWHPDQKKPIVWQAFYLDALQTGWCVSVTQRSVFISLRLTPREKIEGLSRFDRSKSSNGGRVLTTVSLTLTPDKLEAAHWNQNGDFGLSKIYRLADWC